jgi:hypothetical protein
MSSASTPGPSAFAALRGLMRPKQPAERCELCSLELGPVHAHLLELSSRKLVCSCDACAVLFSDPGAGRYRRIPRDVTFLADFRLSDEQWESLQLPINLAFFTHSSAAGRPLALYPSPAGATESLLPLESWQMLVEENPILKQLQPDVEALLVNRIGEMREHYRAPIDECYRLVGLIRGGWRGLSGGPEVWAEIGRFFAGLKERSHA